MLVTPFDEQLKIDVNAYRKIVEWQIEMGCHGIYALCLSSEMYDLNEEERILLVKETVDQVRGRIPVAATGNLDASLDNQIAFAKRVGDLGADVVMLTVPHNLDTDDELLSYFMAFVERTDLPLGLYECPFPRSFHLSIPVIKELAETGRFHAFKETSCLIDKIAAVSETVKGTNLALMQANIPFLLEAMAQGASGSMNVVANWLPDLVVETYEHRTEPNGIRLHEVLCAMEMAQRSVHPAGVKYLMSKRGLPIQTYTRHSRKLTSEERRGLDAAAAYWFNPDFSVRRESVLELARN